MAEPSPIPAQQLADPEPTPLANGTPAPADIEMADPIPTQEVRFPPHTPRIQSLTPAPATPNSKPATHGCANRNINIHARARPATTAAIITQQPPSQRAGTTGADTADPAWEPDEGVLEYACYAAFAGGDEAFGDNGAGEAVEVVE